MLNRLTALCLLFTASCAAIATSTPTTLVELEIQGSPVVLPGGPSIYIDDVYRGNPIGSRFQIWLEAGEHDVRLMGGSELYWEGVVAVSERGGSQSVLIRYAEDGSGTATTVE